MRRRGLAGPGGFFATAQVPVTVSNDVMAELWTKLMVNCAYNAISGLAQATYGQLAALSPVRELQHTVVEEVVALAQAEGVNLALAARSRRCSASPRRCRGSSRRRRRTWHAKAQRDRSPQRLRRTARPRARCRHAGQPGLARAGQARRSRPCPFLGTLPVPAAFAQALRELGLAGTESLRGRPLAGGVSSDIWCIDTERGPVCAKRALAKLRVAADWRAPIERNRYEARWMEVANAARPGSARALLGQHPQQGVLVMSYLPPGEHALWKDLLRDGQADPATACAVGQMLVAIHGYSAARPALAAQFDTDGIFFDIRLEPYLLATARATPSSRPRSKRGGPDAGAPARPGPWRRQSEEHPDRAARPGAARCGMRVVGRPGLRPRLLPQSPAAEVPVEPGRHARLSRCLRACRGPIWKASTGKRAARSRARRRLAAGPAAGAGRRQVAGRIHPTRPSAKWCGVSAAALLRQPVERLGAIAAAWREALA